MVRHCDLRPGADVSAPRYKEPKTGFRFLFTYHGRNRLSSPGIELDNTRYCG